MGNDEKSISGIPISGALAVVALILGLLVIPQEPFKASRPPKTPEKTNSALHEREDVQARLWQDPFSAVMIHRSPDMESDPHGHRVTDLAEQIIHKNSDEIVVLGVMVNGGPYAEDVEARTRFRYAALSALGELGYVPEDSEHIGYLETLWLNLKPYELWLMELLPYLWIESEGPLSPQVLLLRLKDRGFYGEPDKPWAMKLVPYEWFECESSESEKHVSSQVLVLWLNDNSFNGKPLRKLSNLTGLLNDEVEITSAATEKNAPILKYKVLGPASSTNLRAIIKEKDLDGEHKKNLKNVQIFSWMATVDPEKLIPEEKCKKGVPDSLAAAIEKKCRISDGEGLRFFRTIGPDKILTDLLVKELGLRIKGMIPEENTGKAAADLPVKRLDLPIEGMKPEKNAKKPYPDERKVHIALISEWDTVYGRNLPDVFIRSVAEKNSLKPDDINWIYKFGYMRGIDGQVPGKTKVKPTKSGASKKNDTDTEKQDIERPVGQSQFDYLRRLAFRLKKFDEEMTKNNQKRGIQAIGVLGSDVYDKLLVLQAMHKLFPNVIFFTTDIDARLLHPDELLWTQNLVIASNFGLRLNNKLQKNVPPFRDNYQTSLFLSTKIALSNCKMPSSSEGNKWLGSPRIFEVGRSGACALGLKDGLNEEMSSICQILDRSPSASIHQLSPGYVNPWMHSNLLLSGFLALISFTIFFVATYYPFWKKEKAKKIERSTVWLLLLSICFILFLILLVVLFIVIIKSQSDSGEPFAFFEGISIWPSEFLRFLVWGISLYFLITGSIKAHISDKKLSDHFFNPQSNHPEWGEMDTAAKGGADRSIPALSVWNKYKKYTTWKRRLLRILSTSAIYSVMCYFIIAMFGKPFIPYRGDVSFWVDTIAIAACSVPFFIILLISIVDFTIASGWLIRSLSHLEVIWPKEAARDISEKFNMDASYLNEWIDIQVIVKISETAGRFIYYPFIVILIFGASRLRYFDRWDMPLGLLIVIMLGLSFSVYCAASLRNAARQARDTILNKLWERQLSLQALNKKALSGQVRMMYDAIRSMRKGAFCPFFEQPCVRAVALFLGGAGSLVALNYM